MMKMIPNWRSAWRFVSVQIAVVGAGMQGAILAFPDMKDWLGDQITHLAGLLMLVGLVAARLVQQQAPPCPPKDEP